MPADTITTGYKKTALMDIHTVAKELNEGLGPTLVAVLAGVRDRKLPSQWAKSDADGGTTPRHQSEEKLRAAHRVWTSLSTQHDPYIARSWFIGLNPLLEEQAPVVALNEGKTRQVIEAAIAFLEDKVGS